MIIFHIDVNSAYLSWEAVYRLQIGEKLDLRTVASVVGGSQKERQGVVLAKSIKCKPYDIQTGESIYSARKKCKNLLVVPARHDLYAKSSKEFYDLLSDYTDHIEQSSIDEVFMDATNAFTKHKKPIDLADEIRNRIKNELGYTVCVGVSSNKLLAKMATDLRKPDFTNTLFPDEINKMWELPVNRLYSVGRKTSERLENLGIKTIADLAKSDINLLKNIFKSHGIEIWRFANGLDDSKVIKGSSAPKGIGNGTTFAHDIDNLKEAKQILLSLCEKTSARLRKKSYYAKVIAITIRGTDFTDYSKQKTLVNPSNTCNELYKHYQEILEDLWMDESIRYMGIRTSKLVDIEEFNKQISLFDDDKNLKEHKLDNMIDSLRDKYGNRIVQRACFIDSDIKQVLSDKSEDDFQIKDDDD